MGQADLFPAGFDFFGMGEVRRAGASLPSASTARGRAKPWREPACVIFVRIEGEERGICAACFEDLPGAGSEEERRSMAVEIANILAAKLVNRLVREAGLQVSISPPELPEAGERRFRHVLATVRNILAGNSSGNSAVMPLVRLYEFRGGERSARIALVYLRAKEAVC